jgi:TP901 family phage tail tape measure protein
LAVNTRGMERDIKRSFEQVERSAKLDPKIDTSNVRREAERAGKDFASRFHSEAAKAKPDFAGKLGKLAGGAFAGGFAATLLAGGITAAAQTAVEQVKAIFDVGLDFSRTLNNFQGVTRASAGEMQKMQAAARGLGSDTNLAGASASDAALAMTELAKAGFSVDQAISAARGTLQLATAGQIDAAAAAEIQSNAMNAFGLGAESAAHTADLLANAAIASSADIPDIGQALQQVGGIAHGFGENLDDTVAALAMFAQAGVKGSDAGTLLKTTMQSITDQGNPAQGAIKELGLELYKLTPAGDRAFVGFRELFRQLDEAKQRMSSEDFQARTNVLFGSDAMRTAMLGNAAAFDTMLTNVSRVGAASEMAAAQMQGLPGAVEGFNNATEGLRLDAFDLIGPAFTQGINAIVTAMTEHKYEIIAFFADLGAAAIEAAQVILPAFADIAGGIGDIIAPIGDAMGAMNKFQAWQADLRGDHDTADQLRKEAESFFSMGEGLQNFAEKTRAGMAVLDPLKDKLHAAADNALAAKDNAQRLADVLGAMPDGKRIDISAIVSYKDQNGAVIAPGQLNVSQRQLSAAAGNENVRIPGRAGGGAIFGAGGPTSDVIPIWASNGEHVLTASDVTAMGGQGGVYTFRKALHRADGGAVTDQQLIAFAQAASGGRYQYGASDLAAGLSDCSGAVSDLVELLTKGQTNAGRLFSTGDAGQALTQLGAVEGAIPGALQIGWVTGGPGGGHMRATLPNGVAFESGGGTGGGATYGGLAKGAAGMPNIMSLGVSSGQGGYVVDPRAVREAEDRLADREKTLAVQEQQLRELKSDAKESEKMQQQADVDKARRERDEAKADLAEARQGKFKEGKSGKTGGGGMTEDSNVSSFGQSLVSGLLQGIGLDSSVFSNPLEWPNVKSGLALANWGGGMLQGLFGSDQAAGGQTGGGGGFGLPGLNLPGVGDFLKPISRPDETHPGGGAPPGPGPSFVINGNVGMDPKAVTQKFSAAHNQAYRRNMTAVRPH